MVTQAEKEGRKVKKQNAKLRNNVLFGKLIENPMNNFDTKVLNNTKSYRGQSLEDKNNFLMD